MIDLLDYVPVAAAGFAVPQFLPQIRKLRATGDSAGVSPSWAVLTSVNNAAWIAYFTLARYWTALIPSFSATLLAGTLAVMLLRRRRPGRRSAAALIAAWTITLAAAGASGGRAGLGALLTAAFLLQVTPSLWTAYRTARPTGISSGTWLLILGELTCWMIFGLHASDPRLITLGASGIIVSTLLLARIHQGRPDRGAGRRAVPGRRGQRHQLTGDQRALTASRGASGGGQLASLSSAGMQTPRSEDEDGVDISIPPPQAMHLVCNRAWWHGSRNTRGEAGRLRSWRRLSSATPAGRTSSWPPSCVVFTSGYATWKPSWPG